MGRGIGRVCSRGPGGSGSPPGGGRAGRAGPSSLAGSGGGGPRGRAAWWWRWWWGGAAGWPRWGAAWRPGRPEAGAIRYNLHKCTQTLQHHGNMPQVQRDLWQADRGELAVIPRHEDHNPDPVGAGNLGASRTCWTRLGCSSRST